MFEFSGLQLFAVWVIPVLFAITLHEVAHGWAARALGDSTAYMLGRLSLNPLKHIDPVGTILVPALMIIFTPFVFGWAKPVPVSYANLRHPKRDMSLVAAAGPMANLVMALIWVIVIRVASTMTLEPGSTGFFLIAVGVAGLFINTILFVLNLLPLPPLDGGRVVRGLVPESFGRSLDRIEPFGLIILVVLLVSGMLSYIMGPVVGSALFELANMSGLDVNGFKALLYGLLGRG